MSKPSQRSIARIAGIAALVLTVCLFVGLSIRPAPPKRFFRPAPKGLTLHFLGVATNDLKFDREHNWNAFCVSNGTPKTVFYTVTETERRTPDGWRSVGSWRSGTITNASFMTRRETAGEIPPGTTDVFYATIGPSDLTWRLHVGCFESNWQDAPFFTRTGPAIGGPPTATSKSWSGRRYELISEEINP